MEENLSAKIFLDDILIDNDVVIGRITEIIDCKLTVDSRDLTA